MPRRRNQTDLVANEVRILELLLDLAGQASPADLTAVELYGYTLMLALEADAEANGERPISNATVYRCLRRLEQFGAVTSEWESDDAALTAGREGRKRRYYRLAPGAADMAAAGRASLEALDARPAWLRRPQHRPHLAP